MSNLYFTYFIQDNDDLDKAIAGGRMGGVFSLLNNRWIKRPERADFEPDEKLISEKAKTIMMAVDDIEEDTHNSICGELGAIASFNKNNCKNIFIEKNNLVEKSIINNKVFSKVLESDSFDTARHNGV